MDWLKKVLPTLGSMLIPGSPLIGAAVEAVGGALGLTEKTEQSVKDALSSGRLTPEGMESLKKLDNDFRIRLEEIGVKVEELAVKDREGARAMQVATQSIVPHVLAVMFIGFYLVIVSFLLTGQMKLWENSTLTMLLGGITSGVSMILGFYYGSSHSQPGDKK
jgi:hypothetical protein